MGPGNVRWTSSPHGPALPLSRLGGHRFQGLLGGRCGSARSPSIPRPSASAGQSVVGAPAPDPPPSVPSEVSLHPSPPGPGLGLSPWKGPTLARGRVGFGKGRAAFSALWGMFRRGSSVQIEPFYVGVFLLRFGLLVPSRGSAYSVSFFLCLRATGGLLARVDLSHYFSHFLLHTHHLQIFLNQWFSPGRRGREVRGVTLPTQCPETLLVVPAGAGEGRER